MKRRAVCVSAIVLTSLALLGCPGGEGAPSAPSTGAQAGEGGGGGTKPAPKPVEKPFVRDALKTPWKHCKVGDWAIYKFVTLDRVFRFEVTEVGERTVKFSRTDVKSGRLLGNESIDLAEEESRYKDPMTYDALKRDANGNPITPYKQTVTCAGRQVEVLVIKRAKAGMGETELWTAEGIVPAFMQCAVRSDRGGATEVALLDWGDKDRQPVPPEEQGLLEVPGE